MIHNSLLGRARFQKAVFHQDRMNSYVNKIVYFTKHSLYSYLTSHSLMLLGSHYVLSLPEVADMLVMSHVNKLF